MMNISIRATTIIFFKVTSAITLRILLSLFSTSSISSTSSNSLASYDDGFRTILFYWISSSDKWGKFIFGAMFLGDDPLSKISSGWIRKSFFGVNLWSTIPPSWLLPFKTLPTVSSSTYLFCSNFLLIFSFICCYFVRFSFISSTLRADL